jgi:transcriptional regulator with XRE-family HTH domain
MIMGHLTVIPRKTMTFGDWLKAKRKEKGLTQKELADAAGCKEQYVSGLERNADKSRPNVQFVDKWAEKLGVTVDEARRAAGWAAPERPEDADSQTLVDYYENASDDTKQLMRAVIKTMYEADRGLLKQKDAGEGKSKKDLKASKWPRKKRGEGNNNH